MIRLSSPTDEVLTRVAVDASTATPTVPSADSPLAASLRPFEYEQTVGHGPASFETGREVLRNWRMHRDAGVRVDPVPITVGTDVVLWTRTVGLTLVFACRITEVFDDPHQFGFTYATLPGHPEEGFETFRLELINDVVQLHIEGASRPALPLTKLSGPIGRRLQQQFTEQYITSMRSAIRAALDD